MSCRFAVAIPALDCAGSIAPVVEAVRSFVEPVIVVDDGSRDATASVARAAGAEVISHPRNLGKGAALRSAMRTFAERGFTHVLTMDGDGQHLADQIPPLLEAARREPSALVIGARRTEGVEIAPINRFGNRFANRWVEIACGQRLSDTQSGFRVYPLAETLLLGVRSERFAFETEVLIRAARAGLPIRSVPVQVHYPPPAERVSHFRKFRDTARIILVVIGLMLRLW